HYGFDHFFWDVLAFGCLGAACERRSRGRFLVCVVASALTISLSVWFGLSGMSAYRGLSGVDSALLVLLFMELWSDAIRSGHPRQMLAPRAHADQHVQLHRPVHRAAAVREPPQRSSHGASERRAARGSDDGVPRRVHADVTALWHARRSDVAHAADRVRRRAVEPG